MLKVLTAVTMGCDSVQSGSKKKVFCFILDAYLACSLTLIWRWYDYLKYTAVTILHLRYQFNLISCLYITIVSTSSHLYQSYGNIPRSERKLT
jgi:hypothetical protein